MCPAAVVPGPMQYIHWQYSLRQYTLRLSIHSSLPKITTLFACPSCRLSSSKQALLGTLADDLKPVQVREEGEGGGEEEAGVEPGEKREG